MIFGIPKRLLIVLGVLVAVVIVYIVGGDSQNSEGAESGGQPTSCRVTVTADILNVRASPSIDGAVTGQYEREAEADASTVVRNGYRKLAEQRWASDEYLTPVDGAACG